MLQSLIGLNRCMVWFFDCYSFVVSFAYLFSYLMCTNVLLTFMTMYQMHAGAPGSQKKNPLELEFQTVVSSHVGGRD